MRRIAANFAFDGNRWIKKPLILIDEDGFIRDVAEFRPEKGEPARTEFYNGILAPGFINAHTHLELSYAGQTWSENTGMPGFINHVRNIRQVEGQPETSRIQKELRKMKQAGTVGLVDVVNSGLSLEPLVASGVTAMAMLEYMTLTPENIAAQTEHYLTMKSEFPALRFCNALHAPYALSVRNYETLQTVFSEYQVTGSLHFLESSDEMKLYRGEGALLDLYNQLDKGYAPAVSSCDLAEHIMRFLSATARPLFVHNTHITRRQADTIKTMAEKSGQYPGWVLCPRSNYAIESCLPPFDVLRETGLPIMLGTDSLLSAQTLSVFDELMYVHNLMSDIPLSELLQWVTKNPAGMLGWNELGTLEPGKKPGVNLIEDGSPDGIPPGANLNVLI